MFADEVRAKSGEKKCVLVLLQGALKFDEVKLQNAKPKSRDIAKNCRSSEERAHDASWDTRFGD